MICYNLEMAFDPEKITFFAQADARGKNTPFGIKAIDRQRHMYVIGKTGMGKSTLLENMAVQDIQSGEGCAFIDPHGSTAETLLHYVPESRQGDVLYFAPFDMEYPISFNVMEDVGVDKRHLVVSGLMSVFEKIWVDAWSARMAYILQNTIQALLEYPGSTLLGINRMLSDKDYRRLVIDNIKDPSVKSFWVDEFLKYNERYMQEAGDAIKNKIGQFTANPLIRNIIGQPKSSFDIRELMDKQKIIIMNLSKGLVGETNANLLGSMLTTRIYLAAMSRADCSPEAMRQIPNFYFYVDEFQSFANATFANILSEARKYKLNLTIAHQYIEQMEEEVRNAVFGNVGTIVSFRVGPFDAEVLESIFNPQFYATDICNLGFAQVYLTLMIDGIGSPPFSAVTLPPIEPAEISYKDCIIAASRKNYGRPRLAVEQMVEEFHRPVRKSSGNQSAERSGSPVLNKNGVKRRSASGNGNNFSGGNGGGNNYNNTNNTNNTSNGNNTKPSFKERRPENRPANGKTVSERPLKSELGNNHKYQGSIDKHNGHSRSDNERKNNQVADNKPPAKERDLGDLQSVLAKIAKTDDLKAKNTGQESAKVAGGERAVEKAGSREESMASGARQATRSGGVKKPSPDLADAVAATLSNHAATEVDSTPPKDLLPPKANSVSPKVSPPETMPAAPTPTDRGQTASESAAQGQAIPERAAKEITPQELKRRLRVKESERPPLR